ncbi:hypothetical protein PIB30_114723, partial [Stylosanthes scabra]|nr:hypothetical protein [Stylosanthes scabra]
ISEDKEKKNEERKLAEQETKFGSKPRKNSTHMRGRARICVLLRTSQRLDSLGHA